MNSPGWPLISTDSHAGGPPPEVLAERVPKHLRDEFSARVPKIVGEGEDQREIDPETGRRRRPLLQSDLNKVDAASDPEGRLPFLAIDGVGAEVIYAGGAGGPGMAGVSVEAGVAHCQVHNDWLYELYHKHFDRFAPAAAVPIYYDIDEAIKELRRVAKLGLRPVTVPGFIDHKPWNHPEYDRFWAEVNDLQIPVSIHAGKPNPKPYSNPGGAVPNYMYNTYNTMEPLSLIVCAGVLERFPNVNVAFVECDVGWLAWCMEFMDRATIKHHHWVSPKLPMMPSEYVKRQVKCTFQEDPVGVKNRHITGVETIMWGSDFPHQEGTFPHSRDVVAETFADCTVEEMKKITHDTAAKLYNFEADTFVDTQG